MFALVTKKCRHEPTLSEPLGKDVYKRQIITKTRFLIPLEDGHTAELDIFEGKFAGMLLIEVEFNSIEDANSFVPPKWFGKDVTNDGHYHNSYLSKIG